MPIKSLDQIVRIIIELTSHCNLHCPQCARFDRQGYLNKYLDLAHLSPDPILCHLELEELSRLAEIRLEGDHGDPAMSPHLDRIVRCLPAHIMVEVVTNGSLRSPLWWQELAASRTNLTVVFSIDGLADTNATYRIGSDFNKIMNNAEAFIKAGGNAVWKMIVFQHNEHQIAQVKQQSIDLGFAAFYTQFSDRNFYNDRQWPIMIEGQPRGTLTMSSALTETKKQAQHIALERLDQEFQPVQCKWASMGKIYIDFLGNVIPCCMTSGLMWRRDISGQLWQKLVGDLKTINLYNHTLSEILQSDFYQKRLPHSLQSAAEIHHMCVGNCA